MEPTHHGPGQRRRQVDEGVGVRDGPHGASVLDGERQRRHEPELSVLQHGGHHVVRQIQNQHLLLRLSVRGRKRQLNLKE